MYETLLTVFAIFGAGCFLAGVVLAWIVAWGYHAVHSGEPPYREEQVYTDAELAEYKLAMIAQIDDILREIEARPVGYLSCEEGEA